MTRAAGRSSGTANISVDLACRCSEQHPSQVLPQEQFPSGHPQFPPQHSSLGMVINPNGTPRSLAPIAAVGYTIMLPGSSLTPTPILRFVGGAGRAAARAKNCSIIRDDVYLGSRDDEELGRPRPCWLSIHVPHPSAQFGREGSAYSEPRCSTQPGQLHSTPQVQPEPARDAISSMGGMKPKSGMASAGEGEEVENRNGGNSGPGVLSWVCFARLQDGCGEDGRAVLREVELGSPEQHSSAARARVARPVAG